MRTSRRIGVDGRFLLAPLLSAAFMACGSSSDSTSDAGDAAAATASDAAIADADADAKDRDDATTSSPLDDGAAPTDLDATIGDAGDAGDADAGSDLGAPIDASAIAPCATDGAFPYRTPNVTCLDFTPADMGEPSAGENATDLQFALRPSGSAPSTLVLFLNGTGGHPTGPLKAGPQQNLYSAGVENGRAMLGISYASATNVGMTCDKDDACFLATRENVLFGTPEADSSLQVTVDESIVDRTARALRYLTVGDPGGNWSSFLTTNDPGADPAKAIDWTKIVVIGHSFGGGFATLIGKLFPVIRVVQLSSPCDTSSTGPASWLFGDAGTWVTDPSLYFGLAAPTLFNSAGQVTGGDQTCPNHAVNWSALGMKAARQNDNAQICGDTGDTHGESLDCKDNYSTWLTLLE